jgi:hypothetical protein
MYIPAVAGNVMLCLQHDFYNIIFKIKHKLYIDSGSASPPPPPGGIRGAHLNSKVAVGRRAMNRFHAIGTRAYEGPALMGETK